MTIQQPDFWESKQGDGSAGQRVLKKKVSNSTEPVQDTEDKSAGQRVLRKRQY